ncbi:MAG: radical SAM protein [Oligoflexales bacterium]|nr:radical SAM protein [Oligoflexales bacterium]
MKHIDIIKEKINSKLRIDRSDAAVLFQEASDLELMELATLQKAKFHPIDSATYLIMAIVNYTNVCVAKCDYCAFYRLPHQSGTYLLNFEQLCEKIDQLCSFGGRLVGFNGGFHPKLKLQDYAELFSKLRQRYADRLEFYEMTVAEFMFSCKLSKLSYHEGAAILKAHGTRWVTGGGAEILDNAFRKRHSPGKYTTEDYYIAQRALLETGIGSTATMVIGFDETLEERLNHLESLRLFQDSVSDHPLTSFLCWTYKPYNTEIGGEEITTQEYLRWLAICRLYLDNFVHIRTSVLTRNQDALRGLQFGANDFDLPTEDEVTQKAGATISHDFAEILAFGENQGFKLRERHPFELKKLSSKNFHRDFSHEIHARNAEL